MDYLNQDPHEYQPREASLKGPTEYPMPQRENSNPESRNYRNPTTYERKIDRFDLYESHTNAGKGNYLEESRGAYPLKAVSSHQNEARIPMYRGSQKERFDLENSKFPMGLTSIRSRANPERDGAVYSKNKSATELLKENSKNRSDEKEKKHENWGKGRFGDKEGDIDGRLRQSPIWEKERVYEERNRAGAGGKFEAFLGSDASNYEIKNPYESSHGARQERPASSYNEDSEINTERSRRMLGLARSNHPRSATPVVSKLETNLQFERGKREITQEELANHKTDVSYSKKSIPMSFKDSSFERNENVLGFTRKGRESLTVSSSSEPRSASSSSQLEFGSKKIQFYSDEMKNFSIDPKPLASAMMRRKNLVLPSSKAHWDPKDSSALMSAHRPEKDHQPMPSTLKQNPQGSGIRNTGNLAETVDEKMARIKREQEKRREPSEPLTKIIPSRRENPKACSLDSTPKFVTPESNFRNPTMRSFQEPNERIFQMNGESMDSKNKENFNWRRQQDFHTERGNKILIDVGSESWKKNDSLSLKADSRHVETNVVHSYARLTREINQHPESSYPSENRQAKSFQVPQRRDENGQEERSLDLNDLSGTNKREKDPENMSHASTESRSEMKERIRALKEKIEQNRLERESPVAKNWEEPQSEVFISKRDNSKEKEERRRVKDGFRETDFKDLNDSLSELEAPSIQYNPESDFGARELTKNGQTTIWKDERQDSTNFIANLKETTINAGHEKENGNLSPKNKEKGLSPKNDEGKRLLLKEMQETKETLAQREHELALANQKIKELLQHIQKQEQMHLEEMEKLREHLKENKRGEEPELTMNEWDERDDKSKTIKEVSFDLEGAPGQEKSREKSPNVSSFEENDKTEENWQPEFESNQENFQNE